MLSEPNMKQDGVNHDLIKSYIPGALRIFRELCMGTLWQDQFQVTGAWELVEVMAVLLMESQDTHCSSGASMVDERGCLSLLLYFLPKYLYCIKVCGRLKTQNVLY